MASRIGPRSVKDATRFTSTIPHATSKSAGGASPSAPAAPKAPKIPGETPEQRVRRLRLAHLAAQRAQISQKERVIDASRRFLDVAHRWTIRGIVVFTATAGIVSIYSVWDMLRYNRARRAEFTETQKKLEADSLATARLAYVKGTATEAQVLLVEEANREAEETGLKLPPLLSPPEHRTHFEEHVQPAFQSHDEKKQGKGVLGMVTGLFGGSKEGAETAAGASGMGSQHVVGSMEVTGSELKEKAKSAWEAERENQRRGGSLDQLGLETNSAPTPSKKGWRPW